MREIFCYVSFPSFIVITFCRIWEYPERERLLTAWSLRHLGMKSLLSSPPESLWGSASASFINAEFFQQYTRINFIISTMRIYTEMRETFYDVIFPSFIVRTLLQYLEVSKSWKIINRVTPFRVKGWENFPSSSSDSLCSILAYSSPSTPWENVQKSSVIFSSTVQQIFSWCQLAVIYS